MFGIQFILINMKKKLIIFSFALFTSLLAFGQTKWNAYSGVVVFKIKNAGATVTGRFSNMKASLLFSADNLAASSLKGTVEVNTIKTGIDKRDKDLKQEKYFDETKYKLIEISSVRLYKKGTQLVGLFNVTIKGTTKQIEIPFEFTQNGDAASFKGDFMLKRRDFNVGTKGGLAIAMSDDVNVSIEVNAKR